MDMYKRRVANGEDPCETCAGHIDRIVLDESNHQPLHIYNFVHGQVLTRFNGEYDIVVDLNHLALWKAVDEFKVDKNKRMEIFERVYHTFHAILQDERDKEG